VILGEKMKRRHFIAIVVFNLGVIFLFVIFLKYVTCALLRPKRTPVPPEETFRQYILYPIPKSVTNIKADQPKKIFGYKYTFRFNISREDLVLLLDSRPFIEVWNVKYKNGALEWGWDRVGPEELNIAKYGHSMPLYGDVWDLPREPVWFKPGLWDNPEAYVFYKVGDLVNIQVFEHDGWISGGRVTMKVLLYNEKEGEAYFIVSDRENK
jgi:hypothetical protein